MVHQVKPTLAMHLLFLLPVYNLHVRNEHLALSVTNTHCLLHDVFITKKHLSYADML